MKKYVCDVCGWIYDPEVGDPADVYGNSVAQRIKGTPGITG